MICILTCYSEIEEKCMFVDEHIENGCEKKSYYIIAIQQINQGQSRNGRARVSRYVNKHRTDNFTQTVS